MLQPLCSVTGVMPTSYMGNMGPPVLQWQGQHSNPGPSGTKTCTANPYLSHILTLHFCHARLMAVAAVCSLWMCFRVNQERMAKEFAQKQ